MRSPLRRAAILTLLVWIAQLAAFTQIQGQSRIEQPVDSGESVALKGSVHPLAQAQYDVGPVAGNTAYQEVSIDFKLSAAQQADLNLLLQQQQTPGSPNYHNWLTPGEYAQRFGMTEDDLTKVQTWLQQQGFTNVAIPPSRNRVVFSGSATQIERAFQTQLHHYSIRGELHSANATPISIPAALNGIVLGVRHLSDFRPRPRIRNAAPRFTSSVSGDHYVAPDDFATIYDVLPFYNAGYTGSGETIAIVGQSAILASDIANFRSASGLPANAPTMTLVPNSGTSTVTDSSGDEDESDLDVEWSGGIAKAATIDFVYVGNNQNYSVFDSLQYVIDNDLAPVVSISYGGCEANFSATELATYQQWFNQANAQGQTISAAAGDDGAADCEISSGRGATVVNGDEATKGLAVDFPGSSPSVTSVGGTEFDEGSGDYWNGTNNSENGSAISFIPSIVWNDTSTTNGLEAGGGGASSVYGKPSWQTGTGVPSDGARDVPDISLNASPNHDGYLYCASGSDSTSCTNGFRDSSGDLTVAGGTSYGGPTFSAVVTLINQELAAKGQGNVNPEIYTLAASAPTAFHDITSGNNQIPCEAGSPDCGSSGVLGYVAGVGYDLASGWGAIDAYNLAQGFAGRIVPGVAPTSVVLTASTTTPAAGAAITFTAVVDVAGGAGSPSGTVQFSVDGVEEGSPVTLSGGSASYQNSGLTAGTHTVTAAYSGDSADAASSASLTITVGGSAAGSFTLSATNVTVASGGSGASTITVTPVGGYKGTVSFTLSGPAALSNACYDATNATVSSASRVTSTLTIDTNPKGCVSAGGRPLGGSLKRFAGAPEPRTPGGLGGLGAVAASIFLLGFSRRRRRFFGALGGVALLAVVAFNAGCGTSSSSSNSSSSTTVSSGEYTLTVTGTDTVTKVTSNATFTLTVQ